MPVIKGRKAGGGEEKGTSRSRCAGSPGRIQGRAGGDRNPRHQAAPAGALIMA
ncbi:MAG TPA: hypothetical protein PK154_08485 [Methanoregulaceae archaeon]|nr:hypothetical protein [Methanoregulaceae archaeon]